MSPSQKAKTLANQVAYAGKVDARGVVYKQAYRPIVGALGQPGRFTVRSNHARVGIKHFSV